MNTLLSDPPMHGQPHAPCVPQRVVLVVAGAAAGRFLTRRVRRHLPDCACLCIADPVDALLQLSREPAHLVLVDASRAPGGAALARHVGRIAAGATVLLFDHGAGNGADPTTHRWGSVDTLLKGWLATHGGHGAEGTR